MNMIERKELNKKLKMKKLLVVFLGGLALTGCGSSKNKANESTTNNNNDNNQNNVEKTVVQNQIYEGLEFVNVGASNGVIKTIVINNTGYVYEGSKFKMTIMDGNGAVIVEEFDEVKESMEAGTTKEIDTNTTADLTNAASIEYSVVIE